MTVTTTYALRPVGYLSGKVLSSDGYYFDMAGNASGSVLLSASNTAYTETNGTIINASGTAIAGPFPVGTGGVYNYDPAVAALKSGSFVTAYDHIETSGGLSTIEIQRTAANGVLQGSSFEIASSSHSQTDADVAALKNGNFVVSWTRSFDGGDDDIDFQIFKADGTSVTNSVVDSDSSIATTSSSVAGLKSGGFVAAFTQRTIGSSNESMEFRLFDANGSATGAKVDVDTFGSINDQVQTVGLADGGFAIAYRDNGWSGADTDITFQIFNADGSDRTSYIEANAGGTNDDTANYQYAPSITQLANGLIAVSWDSYNGVNYDINARLYDASGNALTDITTLGQTSTEVSNALASQLVGTFLAGWTDYNSTTDKYEVHGGQVNVVRNLLGDDTAEVIKGDNGIDVVTANGGDDKVFLSGGNDTGRGGLGNDLIHGNNGNDRLLGAAGNDTVYGDAGNDIIDGGIGHDTLYGGTGQDTFVFDHGVTDANLQTIKDFRVGNDSFLVDSKVFGHVIGKAVDAKEFKLGTHAINTNQHFIYNASTGALFYDVDGSGHQAQVEMAQLGKNLQLSYHDFKVGHVTI